MEKIKDQPQGHVYGIKLLEPAVTFWGITFPPFVESQKAVVRVLLRCITCWQVEVAYLNEFDTKSFVAHCSLARFCSKCRNWTTWNRPHGEMLTASSFPLRSDSQGQNSGSELRLEIHDKRSHGRTRLEAVGCIRQPPLGDEIVLVVDLAPGGVRFCSANNQLQKVPRERSYRIRSGVHRVKARRRNFAPKSGTQRTARRTVKHSSIPHIVCRSLDGASRYFFFGVT